MTKEQLAGLVSRTYAIAEHILNQLNKTKPGFREKFFYGILVRQVVLLDNICKTLMGNSDDTLTSTFILFRCLLDDFITILYFKTRGFDEADLVYHTAGAFNERFKTIASSKKINYKYFGGTQQGMVDNDYEKKQRQEFLDNIENDRYFKNKKKFELKTFPSVGHMVNSLPDTDLGKANSHAFVVWRHLSHYVHYSLLTYELETVQEVRQIEVLQLKEVLSYCYKTIVICSEILNAWGATNTFNDSTNVWEELS